MSGHDRASGYVFGLDGRTPNNMSRAARGGRPGGGSRKHTHTVVYFPGTRRNDLSTKRLRGPKDYKVLNASVVVVV